jgi:hypothetical protein
VTLALLHDGAELEFDDDISDEDMDRHVLAYEDGGRTTTGPVSRCKWCGRFPGRGSRSTARGAQP